MNKKAYYLLLTGTSFLFIGGTISSSLSWTKNAKNFSNRYFQKGVSSNLLKSNNDVRINFEPNIKNIYIDEKNVNGSISINIDSYQQSNKLSHSSPKLKYNYKFQTSLNISNPLKFNYIKSIDDFKKTLNSNSNNYWSYDISPWWAKAGKRFMGVNIIMPHWAPEVVQNHSQKKFEYWESSQIEKASKFVLSELIKFIESYNFNIKNEERFKDIIKKP